MEAHLSKTVQLAHEAGFETMFRKGKIHGFDRDGDYTEELKAFEALVRADERNSWPAEMEAMERQVNILTDALTQSRKPLTVEQLEKGREQTFSTNNPFCPCDSKTFRKVAKWVEAAHGIKENT